MASVKALGFAVPMYRRKIPSNSLQTRIASTNVRDLTKFSTDLSSGNLPTASFVQPGPAHSMHPVLGVAVTTQNHPLDGFIRQVQAAPQWANTAIIVIWDSSGGWWDHVPPPQVDAQG